MVKISLQIKAQLENLTNLRPVGDDFRWYLKLKCSNCEEVTHSFQYVSLAETSPLKGGRSSASMVSRCKFCARENSLSILPETLGSYTAEDSGQFKTIVAFEGRGMEPIDFSPRVGFAADGADSSSKFDVDLTESDWVDYDEKAGQSVGVYELEHRFERL